MEKSLIRPLVGLTGHKGAGKDEVAKILTQRFGYERRAWAHALKMETYVAFGRAVLMNDCGIYLPVFGDWLRFIDEHKHDAPTSQYGWVRPVLQNWGSEYRRVLCDEDYWIRQLALGSGIVVSDCRFPNEAEAIRTAGGIMWRVERPGYDGDAHVSETQVDTIPVGYTIYNSGDMAHLEQQVVSVYRVMVGLLAIDQYGVR